jgi:transposase
MRDRHRLSKFCLRHGRLLPTSAWTVTRRKWLGEQRFAQTAEQITFDSYLHAIDLVDARIEKLERAIRMTAERGSWQELVSRLRCLRGIDTLSALGTVAGIGDFARFRSAEELMAFVGSSMRHRPPVTRDLRPRQLPTDTSHAVPAGECRSEPPSLLRTLSRRVKRVRGCVGDQTGQCLDHAR